MNLSNETRIQLTQKAVEYLSRGDDAADVLNRLKTKIGDAVEADKIMTSAKTDWLAQQSQTAPTNGHSTRQEIMTEAMIEQAEEKPATTADAPEWETPAHEEIDLSTIDPDAMR